MYIINLIKPYEAVMINIKKCALKNLSQLKIISQSTYIDAFSELCDEKIMDEYVKSAFGMRTLRKELTDKHCEFYFLYFNNETAGYFKINEHKSQTDIFDPSSLEIQRLYIKTKYQRMGLGKYIINYVVAVASEKKKSYIWLGVWEKNKKAIEFYEKNGFYISGSHPFYMGGDRQTDFIMKKIIY
jgi:ribosomal protein S18 acetylase RimI-like enzyme